MNPKTAKIGTIWQKFDSIVEVNYQDGERAYGVYYNYESDANDKLDKVTIEKGTHDIDRTLEHYNDDFEIITPMIQKFPDLYFTLLDVTRGVDSITLYYKFVLDKRAIEVIFFDDKQKIYK